MTSDEFERLAADGYASLPEWVRMRIRNVVVLIAPEPTARQRKEQGLAPNETLLGLYEGIPLSERGSMYGVGGTMPDSITLFQRPIEEAGGHDSEKIRLVIADTIWHEFAHYFGMNEEEVLQKERDKEIGDHRPGYGNQEAR